MRPFFGSHARTSHVQIKVRTHTCAHTQFEVVALRTRTFAKITFFSNFSIFSHQFLKLFSAIFQHFYGLGCSKTEYDDPKQERVFQSRKECSKTGNFVPKSAIAHCTPNKGPHAPSQLIPWNLERNIPRFLSDGTICFVKENQIESLSSDILKR